MKIVYVLLNVVDGEYVKLLPSNKCTYLLSWENREQAEEYIECVGNIYEIVKLEVEDTDKRFLDKSSTLYTTYTTFINIDEDVITYTKIPHK